MAQQLVTVDRKSLDLEDLVDKVFYGVRLDSQTGAASIDKITGDAPIRLPDAYSVRSDDYINWMWTYNTFQFSWENGRLLMEVL